MSVALTLFTFRSSDFCTVKFMKNILVSGSFWFYIEKPVNRHISVLNLPTKMSKSAMTPLRADDSQP